MAYISQFDLDYIQNKYHDASKPFDSFRRFIRRDEIFSSETGLSPEEIMAGIQQTDEKNQHLPHPLRKALAFSYVLENTRISCDKRDLFPAINMIDRPINATLVSKWSSEVFYQIIPEVEKTRYDLEVGGAITIWPDYDHSVPNWDRLFALGFAGILSDSERMRQEKSRTEEEEAFFEGIRITYTAILRFLERLARQAMDTPGSEKLAEALHHIAHRPPESFYEALLLDYLYFMLCEHIEGLQVRSLCHFDRILHPFYAKDLEKGVPEAELKRELAYFLMQFTAIGNYWNQPVFLGGETADGDTEINELSYALLAVYDELGIYNPKIQIKVTEHMPQSFLEKALDMIRRGRNSIVFVSDSTMRKALIRQGATEEEARLCNVKGCYEYSVQENLTTDMNYMNLLKPLEFALFEGCDGVTGVRYGYKSPAPENISSFEEFYDIYKKQLRTLIDMSVETVNAIEPYLSYINPQSMLSATYVSCLESGKDALSGGAKANITNLACGFIADLADSLTMIQKYVFEKKELSLSDFARIMKDDYEGNELFRRKLLSDREKYGNNRERPDRFATEIISLITDYVQKKDNAKERGGFWDCSFHVARMSYYQGDRTLASPNGRKKGEELSKNCSASMGQNREGATAAILSVTKINASAFAGDACLDLGLLPQAVKGDDGLAAMLGLLRTFMKRGGHAIHMNVFDADTLRDAQAHPEKYEDLQIRVCGWNVLWNNIDKVEQDGFIRQAESLV